MTPEQAENLRAARDTLPKVPITGPYYAEGAYCSVGHLARVAGVNTDSTGEVVNRRINTWVQSLEWDIPNYPFGLTHHDIQTIIDINEETPGRWRRHNVVKYINKCLTDNGYPINNPKEALS